MAKKLPNYLRTYRKRKGFTQDEIAYLLGSYSGAKVSRYERFKRLPTLQTALAYQIIFDNPTEELFIGVFQKVERNTIKRIKSLTRKLEKEKPNPFTARKVEILKKIHSAQPKKL